MALRLVACGYPVRGYGVAASERELALAAGITVCDNLADAVADADLVVLAVPLPTMGKVGARVAAAISPQATVIDVGSVKASVRAALEATGLAGRYVGTHPMAGSERSGFAAADPQLLVGAPWVISTDGSLRGPNQPPEAPEPIGTCGQNAATSQLQEAERRARLVRHFLGEVFSAHIIELTDEAHDEAQVLISGLPHVLAVQLLNQVATSAVSETALALAAGSFRDGTRVAYTDPERTKALVTENSANVANVLRQTAAALTDLAKQLEQSEDTTSFFHAADSLRRLR